MSRTTSKRTKAVGRADRWFSRYIRGRGACQRCGVLPHPRVPHPDDPKRTIVNKTPDTAQLQCAHLISRRLSYYRWDALNALCLCATCHHWMTDYPVNFTWWLQETFPETYRYIIGQQLLVQKGAVRPNVDIDERAEHWKQACTKEGR